jgi:uncharacterized membrane protein YccC
MPAKQAYDRDPDWRKVDQIVQRASAEISNAFDKMIADLPPYAAPQMAIERLVRELTHLQSASMQQIMDDQYTREAYEASIAETPATPRRTDF